MGRGRPGGNPDLKKFSYQIKDAERQEAYVKVVTFKTTEAQAEKLKSLGKGKSDFLRNAVEKALEEIS